jgi:hypothetical protein
MASSASFQSTYLTPGAPNAIQGPDRFKVAGALYRLQEQLRMGATSGAAQARVYSGQTRTPKHLIAAQGKTPAGATMTADFQAIDSL